MARNRGRRKGFITRWSRRVWWLRRAIVFAAFAGGVAKAVLDRRGGAPGGRGGFGDGPGGSGRPSPIGGPSSPTRSAAVTPPVAEREMVTASSTPASAARSLVSVPSLPDSGEATDADNSSWVAPRKDGKCPPGHAVKVNEKSGIYHVPGGRFYDRTTADRCYASTEAAEADGYRPAKA